MRWPRRRLPSYEMGERYYWYEGHRHRLPVIGVIGRPRQSTRRKYR